MLSHDVLKYKLAMEFIMLLWYAYLVDIMTFACVGGGGGGAESRVLNFVACWKIDRLIMP